MGLLSARGPGPRQRSWPLGSAGEPTPDGGYVLRVPYSDPDELLPAVLGAGPHVEVLAPDELRAHVAGLLREAGAHYL